MKILSITQEGEQWIYRIKINRALIITLDFDKKPTTKEIRDRLKQINENY